MRTLCLTHLKLVAALTATALVAVGVGVAAWSVSGSGDGAVKAASSAPLTLADASAFTTADLYPGATAALKLRVTNPNSFPVRITSVSGNGAITSNGGAACTASTGVTLTNQTGLALDLAGAATATVSVPGAVAMSNASDTACQGAVFTIPVTVTAVSNAS